MRRLLLVAAILANVHALAAQSDTPAERPSFSSAETLSVTAVTPPLLCTTSGTVVFDAVLSETGKVQKLELRRDIPCLTQLALKAAEEWEFSPATFAGKEIPSRMPVAVTFRPPVAFAAWVYGQFVQRGVARRGLALAVVLALASHPHAPPLGSVHVPAESE